LRNRSILSRVVPLGAAAIACAATAGVALSATAATSTSAAAKPIILGILSQEGIPIGSQPEARQAEGAAVDYIDRELHGVNGRQLKLISCITDGTAARSAACASDLVSRHALAVSISIDNGASGSIPVLEKAGVPLVGGGATGGAESTSRDSFLFVGGSAGNIGGRVSFAVNVLHAKSAVIAGVDVPASTFVMQQAQATLANAGIPNAKIIPVPATVSDFTPVAAQIASLKPDVIFLSFGPSQCPRLYKSLHDLGVTPGVKVISGASCANDAVASAAGADAMEGLYFGSDFQLFSSSNPDMVTFRRAMTTYAPSAPLATYSVYGFQSIMNTYLILKEMAAKHVPITSANLIKALRATRNHRNFLNYTYTCDGKQVPGFPAVCGTYMSMWKYTGGHFTYAEGKRWITGKQYLPKP
jgi:branched-chain amino acid transport system substrate-binding protein